VAGECVTVALRFRDGVEERVDVATGETVLAAAIRMGLPLVHQCESGSCGTCVARLVSGETITTPGSAVALMPSEIESGYRLTCSSRVNRDARFEFDYPRTLLDDMVSRVVEARVERVDWVSQSVVRLDVELSEPVDFSFDAGQYVRIRVPGTDAWRSYSMASIEKDLPRMRFLIRYLAGGIMSEWLRNDCAADCEIEIEIEGPLGSFGIAATGGPHLMIAGGAGLSPILAMLDGLRAGPGPKPPVLLCFGCNTGNDLFYEDELELRDFWMPTLTTRLAVMEASSPGSSATIGTAVSLIEDADLQAGNLTAYVCGPPAMVEAARARLIDGGVAPERIRSEQFRPSSV
jgi:NAD(P)H-flavin reductase/ferredoxin